LASFVLAVLPAVLLIDPQAAIREDEARDRAMMEAETIWLAQVYGWESVDGHVSDRDSRLARMLDCNRHACREEAYHQLKEEGMESFRTIVLLRKHNSAEVRNRAMRLLIEAYSFCPVCLGTGKCTGCVPNRDDACPSCGHWCGPFWHPCPNCYGIGYQYKLSDTQPFIDDNMGVER
jgi:hypothetical protein